MNSSFRRTTSTMLMLTPAALLAACSSSDSWFSSKSDSRDYNSRSDGYYADRSYADSSYRRTDQNSGDTSGRRMSNRYAGGTSVDPYGDGVGAGMPIRGQNSDTLASNDANNPNWRQGPSRYDYDNPSQDNSSSRYNTGISRNPNPAEGTLNNQNIARGTVDNANDGQRQNQNWNQQNQQNQNWSQNQQAQNQQSGYQQSQYQQGQYQANQNQDRQQSDQRWQNTDRQAMSQSTNQNWNEGGQQLPPRFDDTWVGRTFNTADMTTPQQRAAARRMSDPATNPSNSNVQYDTNPQSGMYATGQYTNARYTNSGQDTGRYNDGQYQSGHSADRMNQQARTGWDSGNSDSAPWESRNGVEPWGPQNDWGTDLAENNSGNRQPATRNNMTWTDSSAQAAAQRIADPATNPANSNAQIGQQQGIGSGPSGTNDQMTRSNEQMRSSDQRSNDQIARSNDGMRSDRMDAAGESQKYAVNATPDARILSLLHLKNQEEIEMGRLASQQGASGQVRAYGEMLIRDHTEADARVQAVASQTGTTLLSEAETKRMMLAEKASEKGVSHEKYADDAKKHKDSHGELRSLSGAEFDKAFASKMVKGHQKLIAAVEKAKGQVADSQTRQLLNELLPTLRQHEEKARQLEEHSQTASAR